MRAEKETRLKRAKQPQAKQDGRFVRALPAAVLLVRLAEKRRIVIRSAIPERLRRRTGRGRVVTLFLRAGHLLNGTGRNRNTGGNITKHGIKTI